MEQNQVRTLFDSSCAVVKTKVKPTADEVCEFPLPLVEELAVLFSWPDLLKIEKAFNDITVTEKGWQRLYKELTIYKNGKKKGPTCSHCHEVFDISLSFRDRWLAYSMSSYLMETDFSMNHYRTGTLRDIWPCMMSEMVPESQHPDLSYSQLHPLVMRMAEQVKKMTMRLSTLRQLLSHPQMLMALSTNLRVLELDIMYTIRSQDWLEVIKELTVKGHLQSLQITNLGSECVDWLLLLFIVSGQFHCRLCAQHFNVGLALALKKALRTPIQPSCEDRRKPIDDRLESLQDCLQWSLGDTFEVLHRHARTKSDNPRVIQLQHELAESLSSGQCSKFVRRLKVAKYAGLPADQRTPTTGMAAAGTSAAEEGWTWEEDYMSADDDDHSVSSAEEGEESCGEDSCDTAAPSTSREHCDLLSEALGVQSNSSTSKRTAGLRCEKFINFSRPVSKAQANIRLMEILSCLHMEEGHTTRGIEHIFTSSMTTNRRNNRGDFVSFFDGMACFMPSWTSLSSVSVSTGMMTKRVDISALTSRFFIDASQVLDERMLREDGEYFLDAILSRIREGSFHSLVFNTALSDLQWNALARFFWKVLDVLSGSDHGAKRTQPMRLLKINSFPVQLMQWEYFLGDECYPVGPISQYADLKKTMQTSDSEETSTSGDEVNTGPGLQALYLKFVNFYNCSSFIRLTRFIQGNHALRHISMHDCFLDEVSLDLFLGALDSGAHPSLSCIELNGSVSRFTYDQWQQLSRILRNSPTLSSLVLVRCSVQERQLMSADFVEAVRSHRTERKLTLDISCNVLEDSVWDFMEKTVHPDSSLKELYFKETSSKPQKGVDTMTRLIREHAPHLPLLNACSWTSQRGESLANEVIAKLKQLSKTVCIPGSIEEEFRA